MLIPINSDAHPVLTLDELIEQLQIVASQGYGHLPAKIAVIGQAEPRKIWAVRVPNVNEVTGEVDSTVVELKYS